MDYINGRLTGVMSINDLEHQLVNKQDKLVSGENIKTINNESVLGEGNLETDLLKADLVVTESVGGIPSGVVFERGTSLELILRYLLSGVPPVTADKLYWGTTIEIPTTIENSFIEEDCPQNLVNTGIVHYFTTKIPGEVYGQYNVFAYPASYGNLVHIYYNDLTMFDLISQWTKQVITYDDVEYNLYYPLEATKDENAKYQFLFK